VQRTAVLGLVSVTLFLLLFPLTLGKPGSPPTLKADESAYYLMALSLAHDRDLRLEVEDVDRVFAEFPYRWVPNLIVMTDDGWKTAYYGKPYIYSLFAAPFAALFGANGLIFFNMALMLGMVWLGAIYLSRFNSFGLSALFSSLFFVLSSGFAYVFWIQTEVFNMAAIALSLFLALHRKGDGEEPPSPLRFALSGAALALAVYNKPVFLAMALPVAAGLLQPATWRRENRPRLRSSATRLAAWGLGLAISLGAVAGLATALTGEPTPYLGVIRQGVTVCEPGVLPVEPIDEVKSPGVARARSNSPTGNAWSWLFRIPKVKARELAESVSYFLWGRHTGLLLYLPFSALAVLLFLIGSGRRSLERWLVLTALTVVAFFFLIFIAFNWHGGGGFIGNRYYVCVYPAFLFLVTRIEPRWPIAGVSALAGLFLAPILFTPLGAGGPEPTLQRHVRSAPFHFFPLELSLRNVPGYHRLWAGDKRIIGRKDQMLAQGDAWWIRAADQVEVWMISVKPLETALFQVRSLAPDNQVHLKLEGAEETLDLGEMETRRVRLDPGHPGRVRSHKGSLLYVYRLVISPKVGRARTWTRFFPPPRCQGYAYNKSIEETFPVGAEVTYLGAGAQMEADLYDLQWGQVSAPASVPASLPFLVPVTVTNNSAEAWPNTGVARVKLAYHWLDEAGEVVHFDGRRTDLSAPLASGETLRQEQKIWAPKAAGAYILELDPVFEHVAWFSQKNGGTTLRLPVQVTEATPAGAQGETLGETSRATP